MFDDHEYPAVPREKIVVLADGTFVVLWEDGGMQELETGVYRAYGPQDGGESITDYELKQLKDAGLVEWYDDETVRLCVLPERDELTTATAWERRRLRSYYLNTRLAADQLARVDALLQALGLEARFEARLRDGFVVLWSSKGVAFQKFEEAERARQLLNVRAPEAFDGMVVAFVETTRRG